MVSERPAWTRVLQLDHYFAAGLATGESTGEIVTFVSDNGPGNNIQFARLERRSRAYADGRSSIMLLDLEHFVRVRYVDQLGQTTTAYLRVSPVGGSVPVTRDIGEWAFSIEGDSSLSIHGASPAKVLARAKRHGSVVAE